MTHGNIPAHQIKNNDVLRFENMVSRCYMIITGKLENTINYTSIEFDLKLSEITIYDSNASYKRWNSSDSLYQNYEYCENPRTAIAIIDLFSYKVKFL